MDHDRLVALLRCVYDPNAASDGARSELQAFSRTWQALDWAVRVLNQPTGAVDDIQLHFACATLDGAAAYGWQRLGAASQAALRDCLWRCATEPGRPHFVRAKLAGSLAHVACLEWPQAWPALQACVADPERAAAGLDLLSATLEHFQALAQNTSSGAEGKVLAACIPDIRLHSRQLQQGSLASLCALLQGVLAGGLASTAALGLARRALRALRLALAVDGMLPEGQGVTAAAIAALLFDCAATAQRWGADGGTGEAADEVAAAALDGACDLLTRFLSDDEQQAMLEALLPSLQETCGLVQQRWAAQRGAATGFQEHDPVLTAFVRLLIQVLSTQLSAIEASPGLAAALHGLLGRVLELSTARRRPSDVLLFLEVWHALLSHLDGFESELWEAGDDAQAQARVRAAAAGYKGPLLAIADAVLASVCPVGALATPPPFTLDGLSAAPGSGAGLDDWLEAVVLGGDGGEEREQGREAGAEEDEDEGGEHAGTALAGSPFQLESEVEVYVRHAESFLGRAVASFSADRLPWVLACFQASCEAFAAACQRVAAAAASGGAAAAATALAAALPAFDGLDVCLRLLTRCGPSFPTRGAADTAAPLSAAGGGGPVSGAHAVQSMRALCQLAAIWLQAVQALAAATQQGGQPGTPAPLAAGAAGGAAALRAMLAAGGRLYKCGGSLAATWLSQLIAGLVQGSGDPDAGGVAQELLHGLLAACAALLSAAASPPLAGWRATLHRAAAWAAEALVSLSSVALSGALKPPPALLQSGRLREVAQASLATPALLPLRASRALWLTLSDLSLRCWPAQPAAQFDAAARGAAFAGLTAPLLQLLQQAAAAAACGGGLAGEVAAAARHAAAVAACVVQSYSGSPKALRGIVSAGLVAPALPSIVSLLHSGGGGTSGGAAAALLRLVSAALEVLATELGGEAVEQLLGALVEVFSASGGDPTFESDLLMMQLVLSILSQGGSQRHGALVLPAVRHCLGVWDRAAAARGAAPLPDADLQHVRASALASLLALLRYRWRSLAGGGARPAFGDGGGGAPGAGAHPVAAGLHAAAAGRSQQHQEGPAGSGEGAAAIQRVLQLLLQYFEEAAALQVVLPAADVRLVLEELFELHVATKLYSLPAFQAVRGPLAAALLGLLASRLYGGAREALGDTLLALAAANWSDWHLAVLPRFLGGRVGSLGGGERAALQALFGGADLDAHRFDRCLAAFLNDAAYYERAAAYAAL